MDPMVVLIQAVKQYPEIYNTVRPDYARLHMKDAAWEKITEELHYEDRAEAKTLWSKLRNCHRDALRRKNKNPNLKPWRYERQLEFLVKFMTVGGKSADNLQDSQGDTDSLGHNTPKLGNVSDNWEQSSRDDTFQTDTASVENDELYKTDNYKDPLSDTDNSSEMKTLKRTHHTTDHNTNEYLSRKHSKIETNDASSTSENKELYHFYMSMYNITKDLPLSRQLMLKRNIFNLVTNEQELLCSSNQSQAQEPSLPEGVIMKFEAEDE